jgi:nucleoside-diphosphate-sugar epimerase
LEEGFLSGQVAEKELYHGARVVVLGASGFIGRWVARALWAQGAQVFLVVRNIDVARKIFGQSIAEQNIVKADLRDAASVGTFFRKIRPAVTFNLAGYGVDRSEIDAARADAINAQLVKYVCEAIAQTRDVKWRGQDIVHVGSAAEYGAVGGNLVESSICRPTTFYGESKLAGTCLLTECCQTLGIKGVTARPFTVYGPGEHSGRLLPTLIDAAYSGIQIPLTAGNQKRDFTYVQDVVEGLLRLGVVREARAGEIVNLATGKLISVRDFAETAARIMKIPLDHLKFGAISPRADEMEHATVTVERLRQLISWTPPTEVEEGIKNTISFVDAQMMKRRIDDGV